MGSSFPCFVIFRLSQIIIGLGYQCYDCRFYSRIDFSNFKYNYEFRGIGFKFGCVDTNFSYSTLNIMLLIIIMLYHIKLEYVIIYS